MTEIYFGLIGCSGIAKKHAESLRRIEGVALSAVCDLNAARAEQLGQAYGVNHYANYRRMVESEKIDVVVVLTPSGDHAERVLDLVGPQVGGGRVAGHAALVGEQAGHRHARVQRRAVG